MLRDGKLKIPEIRVENTNLCNAECFMCPHKYMKRKKETMSDVFFMSVVNQAKRLGAEIVSIAGMGEPLMDKSLPNKIARCSSVGIKTFITTNAALLNKTKSRELILAGLTDIRFSVHALSPLNYKKVHKGLNMQPVLININNFLRINYGVGDKVKTHVSVIPFHGEEIQQIRNVWRDKVDFIEVWKPHNWGNKEEFRELTQNKLPYCNRWYNGPIHILSNGDVVPCCMDYEGELSFGNIYSTPLEKIILGDRLKEYQEWHTSHKLCRECDQLNLKDENPLLYSSRDQNRTRYITSTGKSKFSEE